MATATASVAAPAPTSATRATSFAGRCQNASWRVANAVASITRKATASPTSVSPESRPRPVQLAVTPVAATSTPRRASPTSSRRRPAIASTVGGEDAGEDGRRTGLVADEPEALEGAGAGQLEPVEEREQRCDAGDGGPADGGIVATEDQGARRERGEDQQARGVPSWRRCHRPARRRRRRTPSAAPRSARSRRPTRRWRRRRGPRRAAGSTSRGRPARRWRRRRSEPGRRRGGGGRRRWPAGCCATRDR